ncbi:MAG: PA2779 family protein [Vicinamibacterales bacterium]
MRKVRQTVSLVLVVLFTGIASPLAAQQIHAVDPGQMTQALADKVQQDEAQRESIRRVLDRSEAQAAADRLGVDLADAKSAVATLDGSELAELAGYANTVDTTLAGGADTIVISVTTLLLVLILIVLIAK